MPGDAAGAQPAGAAATPAGDAGQAAAAPPAAAAIPTGGPAAGPAIIPAQAETAAAPAPAGTSGVQVAQGLRSLPGQHAAGTGKSQITINLHPNSLGAVQVRIERADDGSATVTLQVDKAETLRALQQDAAHLHQALDRAGVPAEGRQMNFELSQQGSSGFGTPGGASSGGAGMGQGAGSEGQRNGSAPRQNTQSGLSNADPDRMSAVKASSGAASRPSGINITA